MKQIKRFVALFICTTMAFSGTSVYAHDNASKKTVSITSTVSQSKTAVKSSSSTDVSSEPYFDKQWALYNDGTFTPDTNSNNYETPQILPSMPSQDNGYDNRNLWGGQGQSWPGLTRRFQKKSVTVNSRYTKFSKTTAVSDIDMDAPQAWNVVGDSGRDVIVAVIDTGVDYTQEDLKNAVWTNTGEIAGDGIDNDNNGYIDDVYGWDFYNNKPFELTSDSSEYEHATHVAGIIAASYNNKTGIAGIIPNSHVKIMSIKALGGTDGSGDIDSIINAIKYAEKMGASICNLSFGTEYNDSELEETIKASKMLFVCAAGNGSYSNRGDNIDNTPEYPASYDLDNIISVANLSYNGKLDSTSNYGKTSVDIAAPGTYIMSTLPDDEYGYMSGTSMAAPMVTAVSALVYSYRQDISLSKVRNIVLSSAQTFTSLKNKVAAGGMLNAYNAVTADPSSVD